jgi:hypothetical protein
MPLNSQGTIQVFSDAAALATYAYASQDTGVFLREIPSGGTVLELPASPNDGDWYEWENTDGTCSSTHPIILTAAEGTTVQGGASITYTAPYAAGMVRYSSRASNWVVVSEAGEGVEIQSILAYASTGQTVTGAYVAVAGCIATFDITSATDVVAFWAALNVTATGSEAAGVLTWKVVLDPAGANTTVGISPTAYAADAASVNGGAVSGVVSDLTPGTHVLELQVIGSLTGVLTIGTIGGGSANATMTVQISQ